MKKLNFKKTFKSTAFVMAVSVVSAVVAVAGVYGLVRGLEALVCR